MLIRVGIVGGGHSGNDARILTGICRYVRPARPWVLHDATRAWDDRAALRRVLRYRLQGLIVHGCSPELLEAACDTGLPAVNTSNVVLDSPVPRVGFDDYAVGELAANYLLSLGFRHFAYVGDPGAGYSELRLEGYRAALGAKGCCPSVFTTNTGWLPQSGPPAKTYARLIPWVLSLPKPVAVFTAHDQPALLLGEICREQGIAVPDEVALLGVDDYEIICQMAYPPLSSIRLPAERLGVEAARMLDQLMAGQPLATRELRLPPAGVFARQSTDVVAADDPLLSEALRFIRDHACQRINVRDVLRQTATSRSSLCRRFRHHLGRGPLDEIHRVRCETARKMLIESDLTIAEIARACGFRDLTHMGLLFRRHTGMSPTALRRQVQPR